MADEQKTPDGAFKLNQDLTNQLPVVPQQTAGATATEQVVYATPSTPQTSAAIQYADPSVVGQTSYAYSATVPTIDPSSTMGKLKAFFAKPIGKIILFTALFLGIAGMIMYSSSSVGVQGSFFGQNLIGNIVIADAKYTVGTKVLSNWDIEMNRWEPATITKVNTDGTYNVTYESGGDGENRTKKQLASLTEHPTEVKMGQIVVYKHPTKNEYYNGLIIGGETEGTMLVVLVGAKSEDKNKPNDSPIVPLDLNSAYLTLEGYQEVGSEMFNGSSSDTTTTGMVLNNAFIANLPGITAMLGATTGNKPPLAPAWTAPAANSDIALAEISKTEFKWTAGVDADQGPAKNPNYEFAIIKGEITDQAEIEKIFSDTGDIVSKKYDFAWVVKWTEKTALEEIQKLMGVTNCVVDIGEGKFDYECNKFVIPPNVVAEMKEGQKFTAIVQQGDGAAGSPFAVMTFSVKKPDNKPPLAPVWTAPTEKADIALADLAKTEFKWTAGVDADQGPVKIPNYQFGIIKGEITDQAEIAKIFTDTKAGANSKYDFVWITRWAEKATQDEIQKLIGATNCVTDIGGNSNYVCDTFIIPSNVVAEMKEGQKFTAIVQQGDGLAGSPYAITTFTTKKAEECALDQYFIKDSKNSGCKKIPSFKGAAVQAGFICGLYETILNNPDNSYHLSSSTKANLQKNIDSQCNKKPDIATDICLSKMTYVPTGKTMCEPFKIITDPALSEDVCSQYAAEKDNKSLSVDTIKQLATIAGVQCKPKICPTGKFLNGISAPDDCENILTFPTKISNFNIVKSCETMKAIAESKDALSVYLIDKPTLDQINIVAKGSDCNPKFAAADEVKSKVETKVDTKIVAATSCEKGYYLAGTSIEKDCKKLPDLSMLTSISEISEACQLYKDLTSKKIDGKMSAETALQVKESSSDVLCDQTILPTPSNDTAPPSLTLQPPVKTVIQPQQSQANVLGSLAASSNDEAPPSLNASIPQQSPTKIVASSTPKIYEALPVSQVTNYQPAYPVAGTPAGANIGGSYVPRKTAETGPEMWIYSFGFAFATIGSRKWKNKKK